jgi:hypothetical protein
MSHFVSPRSNNVGRSSGLRGRGISGERAAAIRARFGLLGVLLVALYNLLVCACARYEVEVVGDLPQAQELARLEAAGDQEGIQQLLKGMIKIKQDRDDVNFFFRQLLKKGAKVTPGAPAAAGAAAT